MPIYLHVMASHTYQNQSGKESQDEESRLTCQTRAQTRKFLWASHFATCSEDIRILFVRLHGHRMGKLSPLAPGIRRSGFGMHRRGSTYIPLRIILRLSIVWPGRQMERCLPLVPAIRRSGFGMCRQDSTCEPSQATLVLSSVWPGRRMARCLPLQGFSQRAKRAHVE